MQQRMTRSSKRISSGKDFIILTPILISLVQVKDEKKENKDIQEASTITPFNLEMEILEVCVHECSGHVQDLLFLGALSHQLTQSSSSLHHSSTISPTAGHPLSFHPTTCKALCIFSTSDSSLSNPACSWFDTDSFQSGVNTLCSVTMSCHKEHFQDLKLVEGATVTGTADGIVVNS
jgi:hypothetical protein